MSDESRSSETRSPAHLSRVAATAIAAAMLISASVLTCTNVASADTSTPAANSIPTVSCTTPSATFNTGYNAATGTTLPGGGPDSNWTVAGGHNGLNSPAGTGFSTSLPAAGTIFLPAVVGNAVPSAWLISPYGNADWISTQNNGVDNQSTGNGDFYYRYQFNLASAVDPSSFALKMDWLADNDVAAVWVNNATQAGLNAVSQGNDPYQYRDFVSGNQSTTTLDNNWRTGLNTILVEIKSGGTWEGFNAQVTSTAVCPPAAVAAATTFSLLGKAGTYSALAGAAITAPASTMLTGNVGAGAALTTDGNTKIAYSEIQNTDATAQALHDLSLGYAALRTLKAQSLPGAADLGGQTLKPGTYHSDAALTDSGTLTFDAQGDPNATFIIQTNAAINTTAGTQMVLLNGAQSSNIFWVSDAATTLGAGSLLDGTIVSKAAITVGAGSVINGRALSLTAAITLDADSINSIPVVSAVLLIAPTQPASNTQALGVQGGSVSTGGSSK